MFTEQNYVLQVHYDNVAECYASIKLYPAGSVTRVTLIVIDTKNTDIGWMLGGNKNRIESKTTVNKKYYRYVQVKKKRLFLCVLIFVYGFKNYSNKI